MTKQPYYHRNTGKPWADKDNQQLRQFAKGNMPTDVIGVKLGRTEAAIYAQASRQGISLEPPNPHHKRKPAKS